MEQFLLVLAHHQMKVRLTRNLAKFELRVCLGRSEKFTIFSGFFKHSRLDSLGQLRNLDILIPKLVLVLSLLRNDPL